MSAIHIIGDGLKRNPFLRRLLGKDRRIPRLNARDAYRLWAPTYKAETATSFLDDQLAHEMLTGLPHTHLLDAGCGIGRRIANIPNTIGMDASPEMLSAGGAQNLVVGDVRAIPFPTDHFDMVWCRLVLGHLPDALPAYLEFARVIEPDGYLFITDFHPDAVLAGHRRYFTDANGVIREVEHYVHKDHVTSAENAGFTLVSEHVSAVGPAIKSFYQQGIGLGAYERDLGLKLVSAFLFRQTRKHPKG